MHSRIYEVSTSKIPMYDRLTSNKVYKLLEDECVERFFDYIVDIKDPKKRSDEINWIVNYLGTIQNIKGQIVISERIRNKFFKEKYNSFIKYAKTLSTATFDDFKSNKLYGTDSVNYNLFLLKDSYNEKNGFYVFNRQAPEGEQLMTLDSFMREQMFNPHGSRTYWFGGILDYHF